MEEKRTSGVWITVAVLLLVLVSSIAYVGGYFWLDKPDYMAPAYNGPGIVHRVYSNRTLTTLYQPAGMLESWFREVPVLV